MLPWIYTCSGQTINEIVVENLAIHFTHTIYVAVKTLCFMIYLCFAFIPFYAHTAPVLMIFHYTIQTLLMSHIFNIRARNFHGRQELLQSIKEYLRSDSTLPFIVYGKSGMGRKSLVCKAARDSQKWCKQ